MCGGECVHVYEMLNLLLLELHSKCPCTRPLNCHSLSVTVTHFGLQSRTPATHRISHAEKNLYASEWADARKHDLAALPSPWRNQARLPESPGVLPLGANYQPIRKKSVFCICCIWVRFNPATNENKASCNCA